MGDPSDGYRIRLAVPADALRISLLYHYVYQGTYSDLLMRNVDMLSGFLTNTANAWVLAEKDGELVGSVVWETDERNRLAKVFGGAVLPQHRGANLLERAMRFGSDHLGIETCSVDVMYATTRTATKAPQVITEKLGFKKLGIFPNVHRTDTYETHCLTAFFCEGTLAKRFTNFKLHPKIAGLFRIIREETGIPGLPVADPAEYDAISDLPKMEIPVLEIIDAPVFALQRFHQLREDKQIPFHFYPFHEPNMVISSPCQRVELFVFLSPSDKYCTIVGIRKPDDLDFTQVLLTATNLLRDRDVRYIETIARCDKLRTLDSIIRSGFVPCGYFPAFQLHDRFRYDYAVFSKTFEILDFRNIKLAGTNREFLIEYFKNWREIFLDPSVLMDE